MINEKNFNVVLLPVQESNLYFSNAWQNFYISLVPCIKDEGRTPHHIYILSNETIKDISEIKPNTWVYDSFEMRVLESKNCHSLEIFDNSIENRLNYIFATTDPNIPIYKIRDEDALRYSNYPVGYCALAWIFELSQTLGINGGVTGDFMTRELNKPLIMDNFVFMKFSTSVSVENNKKHLLWIFDRMVVTHNENPDADYMIKFKKIINTLK